MYRREWKLNSGLTAIDREYYPLHYAPIILSITPCAQSLGLGVSNQIALFFILIRKLV